MHSQTNEYGPSRRRVLQRAALATAAGVITGRTAVKAQDADAAKKAREGRLRQSIIHWCFKDHWGVEPMARVAAELGCHSIELIAPEHWPTLKKHGLSCAICSSHGFVKGFNNPRHWPECIDILTKRIDACAEAGVPSVITFTWMR